MVDYEDIFNERAPMVRPIYSGNKNAIKLQNDVLSLNKAWRGEGQNQEADAISTIGSVSWENARKGGKRWEEKTGRLSWQNSRKI